MWKQDPVYSPHEVKRTHVYTRSAINIDSGSLAKGGLVTIGNRVDSYYEYLLKQWLLSNQTEPTYLSDYKQAMRGVQKHLVSTAGPYTFVGELENWVKFSASMDHLGCFLPGLLALGHSTGAAESNNDLKLAEKLMFTCFNFYNQSRSKMSPETVVFESDTGSSNEVTPIPPPQGPQEPQVSASQTWKPGNLGSARFPGFQV